MSMMGDRVQFFSHEVGSVIVRWYIGKGTGLADEMFSCKIISNVNVLSSGLLMGFSATSMREVLSVIIVMGIV